VNKLAHRLKKDHSFGHNFAQITAIEVRKHVYFFVSLVSLYLSLFVISLSLSLTHPQREYRRTPYKRIPFIPHAYDQLARFSHARSFVFFSHARSFILIFT
jgi:hypothetical protein